MAINVEINKPNSANSIINALYTPSKNPKRPDKETQNKKEGLSYDNKVLLTLASLAALGGAIYLAGKKGKANVSVKTSGAAGTTGTEGKLIPQETPKKEQILEIVGDLGGADAEKILLFEDIDLKDKQALKNYLLSLNKPEGAPRFLNGNVDDIVDNVTPDNGKLLEQLINWQENGEYRFSDWSISDILKLYTTPENKNLFERLANWKDGEKYRFNCYSIAEFMRNYANPEYKKLFEKFANLKEGNKYRLDGWSINKIMDNYTTDENRALIEKLLSAKEGDTYRFSDYNIGEILGKGLSDEKNQLIKKMVDMQEKGQYRFNGYNIADILNKMKNPEEYPFAKKLIDMKDEEGYRFLPCIITDIIDSCTTPEHRQLIEKIINLKEDGKYKIYGCCIPNIAEKLKVEKESVIKELLDEKISDSDFIKKLTEKLDFKTIDFGYGIPIYVS